MPGGRIFLACLLAAGGIALAAAIADNTAPRESPATAPAVGDAPLARLTVHVVDLRNRKGQMMFGVFDSAKGFPGDSKRARNWQVREIDADILRFTVDLPPGRYAATALHDENANNKMDQNLLGVPREGYGVTNNPKPRFRGARFGEALISLPPEGAEFTISLQYF